jgi:hypothetical protein
MLAVSLPVIIHLLGRRKRRTINFATLRFLERAAARASARWRLKRLLLLLARMLALAALVALFAGPGWESEEGTTAQLKVLVVDTSLSMSAKVAGETPLEQGKLALEEIFDNSSTADRFVLITTGAGATGVGSETTLLDRAEAQSRVSQLKQEAYDGGLVKALEKANAAVASVGIGGDLGAARIVVVTDMQRHAWRELAGLGEIDTQLTIVDVGLVGARNNWIEKVTQRDSGFEVLLGAGATEVQEPRKVVFSYGFGGDESVDSEAGRSLTAFVEEHRAVFSPASDTVSTLVAAKVDPGGALAFDDTLELVANPFGPIDVLLVNGDPRGFEIRDELLFMRRALGSGGKLSKRFVVKEVRQSDLSTAKLDEVDVVWLANPAPLTGGVSDALALRAEEGMGIVVSAGDQWRPDRTDDYLLTLLAAPLRDKMTLSVEDSTRPPFETLDRESLGGPLSERGESGEGDELATLLQTVRVSGYWLADVGLGEGTKVWARLTNNAPLVVEKSKGKGRYLLLATSVDRDWSELCLSPAFLPLLERLITHAAGRSRSRLPDFVVAGSTLNSPFADSVEVEGPDGRRQRWSSGRGDITLEQTGVYRVFSGGADDKSLGGFVVRADSAESVLERFDTADLAQISAEGTLSFEGEEGRASLGRRDLSAIAGVLLMLALAAEALLSARWPRRSHIRLEQDDVG